MAMTPEARHQRGGGWVVAGAGAAAGTATVADGVGLSWAGPRQPSNVTTTHRGRITVRMRAVYRAVNYVGSFDVGQLRRRAAPT